MTAQPSIHKKQTETNENVARLSLFDLVRTYSPRGRTIKYFPFGMLQKAPPVIIAVYFIIQSAIIAHALSVSPAPFLPSNKLGDLMERIINRNN